VGVSGAPTDRTGLTAEAAAEALARHGPNEVTQQEGPSALSMLLAQFQSPLVALLLVAAVVAGVLGEGLDAAAIGFIVLLNAGVGFAQERQAEQALAALRSMTAPRARVRRDGRAVELPAREVVVGDVLLLEGGDVVAADARLLTAHSLRLVEAPLTGESMPVDKGLDPVDPDAPLAERTDRVFAGTTVATGTAEARVTATGMGTELGRIADLLSGAERGETPLQARLRKLSGQLLWLCLAVVLLVALLGLWRGTPWLEVLLASVALAVAVVPEGLPAVVTIALAAGVQRMAAHRVLIRRLPAVETLGSTTVICTDKTGTLTTGEMRVRELWAGEGGGDENAVVEAAVACVDAELGADGQAVGDPTEVALLLAGRDRGVERTDLEHRWPRLAVQPFDSLRKRMSVLRRHPDGREVLYVKGALSHVGPLCSGELSEALAAEAELAGRGLRVLAVATGDSPDERDLTLLGLVGLADPPRPEAIAAVAAARRAGITTIMVTGDHKGTATAIARELGVIVDGEDPDERVHARVTPEDKIRTVREWKARGHVVAMTGDGVNDAPAVREAHVGIAMGGTGTEVTRAAASVVLTDDNYASIVEGIRQGRAIAENIRHTVVYLLRGNAAELVIMLGATLVGAPLPLLPIQLLWVNLATDGLPALALVVEPPGPDVLDRPPRPPDEPVLGRREWRNIALAGALEATVVLSAYAWALDAHGAAVARTIAFDTLVACELLRAFAARSEGRVLWELGLLTNPRLLAVVAVSAGLQVGLHLVPPLAEVFALTPLTLPQLGLVVGLGLIPVTVLEVSKLVLRSRRA
jgi:Ca2+-transporting ATPase